MTCGLLSWLAGCHWQHQMFNETVSFVCLRKLNASNQTIRKPRSQHLNMLNAVLSTGNPRETWGTDPRSTQKRHGCKNEQNGVAVNGEQTFLGPSSNRETSTRFLRPQWDQCSETNKHHSRLHQLALYYQTRDLGYWERRVIILPSALFQQNI